MNTLTSYIKAINKQKAVVSIVSESHKTGGYINGEIEVNKIEKTYHFNNGVVIKHKIERDNAPSDLLCEAFILCSVADNTTRYHQLNTEIFLFLLSLLSHYKKENMQH